MGSSNVCHLQTHCTQLNAVTPASYSALRHFPLSLMNIVSKVLPCQYHSTIAPYAFIHLPPTHHNVSLLVLLFSPVTTIPPMLHNHSLTYHPHYIIFLSHYFSFPLSVPFLYTHSFTYDPHYTTFLSQYFNFALSVPFHQCSIPIHSPTTHTIQCFSPSTSVFPCKYHSTNAPYPFIHLPPTLYNVSLPVLLFSLVSTIPPMPHTHSFTYHPRYIMFLSQYFCFLLSVPFHQCPIPIPSPTTHAI